MYVDDTGKMDRNYVNNRLSGTVVRVKDTNDPVLFEIVGNNNQAIVGYIDDNMRKEQVPFSSIAAETPSLGYTNYDGSAYYLSRLPRRRDWRQGLRRENMVVMSGRQGKPYMFRDYIPLVVPIKLRDKYPKYSECLDRVEDYYTSCAFSPLFAIDKDMKLLYKGGEVGRDAKGVPTLAEGYFWLEETLRDVMTR